MVLRRVSKFFSEKKHQAGEPGGSLDPANYLFSDLGDQLAGRKTIKYNDIFLFKIVWHFIVWHNLGKFFLNYFSGKI